MFKRGRRPRWVDGSQQCSFCEKPHADFAALIAGPGVCICNEGVVRCNAVLELKRTPSH
jgi:ATP-dependent protease Clp ATPase subunit